MLFMPLSVHMAETQPTSSPEGAVPSHTAPAAILCPSSLGQLNHQPAISSSSFFCCREASTQSPAL